MTDSLLRLSQQIDGQIPQFLIVALVRWLLSSLKIPILSLAHRLFPKACRLFATFHCRVKRMFSFWLLLLWMILASFVTVDLWKNSEDVIQCEKQTAPRPMGVSAGVALLCFVFTTKLSVSVMSLVTFVCVKELNFFAGLAALLTSVFWGNFPLKAVLCCLTFGFATAHATLCVSPSSAALSMACFCCVCAWIWKLILSASWAFLVKSR